MKKQQQKVAGRETALDARGGNWLFGSGGSLPRSSSQLPKASREGFSPRSAAVANTAAVAVTAEAAIGSGSLAVRRGSVSSWHGRSAKWRQEQAPGTQRFLRVPAVTDRVRDARSVLGLQEQRARRSGLQRCGGLLQGQIGSKQEPSGERLGCRWTWLSFSPAARQ